MAEQSKKKTNQTNSASEVSSGTEKQKNEKISKSSKTKIKKIKGENEPKKPLTAFFLFLKDEREKMAPGIKIDEQTRILKNKWEQLDISKKDYYKEQYTKNQAKYKEEMEKYMKTDEYKSVAEENVNMKKMKGGKNGKPKIVRKPSGYNIFVKEERAKISQNKNEEEPQGFKEITQLISKKWRGLTDSEKNEYNKKAKDMNDDEESVSENREP